MDTRREVFCEQGGANPVISCYTMKIVFRARTNVFERRTNRNNI